MVKWENKVEEYIRERGGGLDQERKEYYNRENWRIVWHGHLLGGKFQKGVRYQSYRYTEIQ